MQMRESGCRNHYRSVLMAETKAKTVTSPLIIPSVLGKVFFADFIIFLVVYPGCQESLYAKSNQNIP